MTREEVDSESFDGSIDAGTSETLEVDTGRASEVVLYVDGGTTGTAPASYSLSVDAYHDEVTDYLRQQDVGATTALFDEFSANGSSVRITLTDESATANTRRIVVKSYRDMD